MMEFRDLRRQYQELRPQMDAAVTQVMAGGGYIGGKAVASLEETLAGYVGVRHCISCANGTDALTLALKVWGIGPGDAVLVPDFTFFSSAETVAAEGATPVFVDVDEETFNISLEDMRLKYDAVVAEGVLRCRVAVVVDLFGQPAAHNEIREFASARGMMVLEDGAQGFGGSIDGKMACSFGDIATTSFFPAKPLGCYGDGGAIFTDNDEWAELLRSLKVHGKGTFKYDNVRLGMNSRLDTLQAAVLGVKFEAFRDRELDAVNRVAALYTSLLEGVAEVPVVPAGYVSSWAQYTLRLKSRSERDALQEYLKSQGIPSMVYYPTGMHGQTAFRDVPSYGPCPVSERLCATVLSLPMHPYMPDSEVDIVASAVKSFLK